ncbi:hypothetical protein ACIPL1_24475 [Pseudomonas sp. NPDC090202]|uniref:glycine zipper domain-containing protein n=1 Tax=unclassified Pseudomonas TaxID=196821 RepID=UPI0037F4ABB0
MASSISEILDEDLYRKTREQLNTFLDETNALLAAGDALHEDRTELARQRLAEFLQGKVQVEANHETAQPLVERVLAETKGYVKAHPWAAVGAAAAVGVVVSLLLKRGRG